MSNGKKISFSFSKVKKPSLVNKANVEPKEKIDYVDCFDGAKGTFSYKGNVKKEPSEKQELVIPLVSTRTSIEILKSRIEEKAVKKGATNGISVREKKSDDAEDLKQYKNLEELAAQEILKDLAGSKSNGEDSNKLVIETDGTVADPSEHDIDYDNIPVSDFGMALLRGMGWKPNTGIGKEPRLVPTVSPKLRPKGLGLGAKQNPEVNDDDTKNSKTVAKEIKK